ncbi:sulfurtransferase [soil metagenome]
MEKTQILNISAYKFVGLPDCQALRDKLHAQALKCELRGTVLLAEEGINLFLAGAPDAIRLWLSVLREDGRFADLAPKESWSETLPFKKLLVKVKREIIRMNHPAIRPDAQARAPALPATTLARWLDQGQDDEGRPVVMLDTRNAFEVDYGGFENAIDWRIAKFSEFPAAVAAHRAELLGKTVVSYCTGGIRCEKAAIYLQQQGLDGPVYQLDGGILKYFEEAGGAHYRGDCFVFDQREALDAGLTPSTEILRPSSEAHRAKDAA